MNVGCIMGKYFNDEVKIDGTYIELVPPDDTLEPIGVIHEQNANIFWNETTKITIYLSEKLALRILDEDGNPIGNLNINVQGKFLSSMAQTDSNGLLTRYVPPGVFRLSIRSLQIWAPSIPVESTNPIEIVVRSVWPEEQNKMEPYYVDDFLCEGKYR